MFSLILHCYGQRAPERMLGIGLVKLSPVGDQFARIHDLQYHIGIGCQFLPQCTIYIRNDAIRPDAYTLSETGKLIHFQISITGPKSSHQITHAWPPDQWDQRCQMLKPPNWSNETNHRLNRPDPGLFNWS
jgi:hypothetical protein